MLGWSDTIEKRFNELNNGDILLAVRRQQMKYTCCFIGTISKDKSFNINEFLCRKLKNFIDLRNYPNNLNILEGASFEEMKCLFEMIKIDESKNYDTINRINQIIAESEQNSDIKK